MPPASPRPGGPPRRPEPGGPVGAGVDVLPLAPSAVADGSGSPQFGVYAGALEEADLANLRGDWATSRLRRLLRTKRWFFAFAATEEVVVQWAVLDASYTATAFLTVSDRVAGRVLVDRGYFGAPPPLVRVGARPSSGLDLSCRWAGGDFKASGSADSYRLSARAAGPLPRQSAAAELDLRLDRTAAPALTVIVPLEGTDRVNVTVKTGALPATGRVTVGEWSYDLAGGWGGTDYSAAFMPRRVEWRWAYGSGLTADGRPVAVNLVEGYTDRQPDLLENAVWLDGRLHRIGPASFEFDRDDPTAPWRVRTRDGAVDLTFRPWGLHREDRNLLAARSRFAQPVGSFTGTLGVAGQSVAVQDMPGVAEDQAILW